LIEFNTPNFELYSFLKRPGSEKLPYKHRGNFGERRAEHCCQSGRLRSRERHVLGSLLQADEHEQDVADSVDGARVHTRRHLHNPVGLLVVWNHCLGDSVARLSALHGHG
jgi:hypothetical protein